GLTIPFDPATRTYTLHLEEHLSLTWDVDVLLGAARILVNGQTLGLNMARTPELLTYFLTHRKFTLPQLQVALFADHPHKRSKSYIHQVRAELQRLVPGLTIPFDPATRTYTLHLEEHLSLTWDVDVLLGA
ncbi:hypothetical protein CTI14_47395, partial [Methylobacterium radiotolerans]